jgi:alkylation response protein AidB-like acyl-CoA dehydrogenase
MTGAVAPRGRPGLGAGADLDRALTQIAAGARARDAVAAPGPFPAEAFELLRDCGALSATAVAGTIRPPAADELALIRRVAGADGSVGRIFDGHINAVERLAVQGPGAVRDRELTRVRAGESLLGVWGGEPVPGEGPPAQLRRGRHGEVLRGVKTFCSGAGGIQCALVLARDPDADRATGPSLVLVDVSDRERVAIDAGWYRARGLVASASHRVVFHDAPVLARLGAPGAITAQPWFARDALRTAASWAGMADTAVAAALTGLRERPRSGDLEALAAGRILTAQRTIDVWLTSAAAAMDDGGADLSQIALHGRVAIAESCRTLLDEAARACGSHPFATAGALDRARRDLQLFLMQHRLEPMLARAGAAVLAQADGR